MTSWFNDISLTNGVISIVECGTRGVDFPKDGDGRPSIPLSPIRLESDEIEEVGAFEGETGDTTKLYQTFL